MRRTCFACNSFRRHGSANQGRWTVDYIFSFSPSTLFSCCAAQMGEEQCWYRPEDWVRIFQLHGGGAAVSFHGVSKLPTSPSRHWHNLEWKERGTKRDRSDRHVKVFERDYDAEQDSQSPHKLFWIKLGFFDSYITLHVSTYVWCVWCIVLF